jgi:hypothetical protein
VLAEEEQRKLPADVLINFTLLYVVIFVEMVVRFQLLTLLQKSYEAFCWSWVQAVCFYI